MIIPIFVPHEGCGNSCVFCDQRTISGSAAAPTINEAEQIIESHLATMDGYADQIAFFGGSFTGIAEERQNEYLALAEEYIKKGSVGSIRLSTRPDYISSDTVKRLLSYGVKNIELGAQSMDDRVLKAANRGHSAADVMCASEIILKEGAVLGLQMMTGLPFDSDEADMFTARKFFELGARETRIYPTIVISGTKLDEMRREGNYRAQSLEQAVEICARLYEFFKEKDIQILRIGLPDSEKLKRTMTDGPYHPAFGELVISRVIRNQIIARTGGKKEIVIRANPRLVSKINGNKKCNADYFKSRGITFNVISDSSAESYEII